MTLLIATQDPDTPAETYVRQHMRCLAPGATVGVGFRGSGVQGLDIPFHTVRRNAGPLIGKPVTALALGVHGFTGAPMGEARHALRSFMKEHDVSVVLAEFGPTGAALRSLCREMHLPLLVNFHGYDATVMPRSRLVRHAYRLLARDAAAFIGGSRHFCARLIALGFAEQKVHVVPCGIETARFGSAKDRTGRRILAVGRLTAKKAPQLTIQAIARAREAVPDLSLDIVGDGPMRAKCEAEIIRLGLTQAVTLHGACDHDTVRRMLARADVFVQHSIVAPNGDTESQGISLVEAMASHLPVVTTDHNGFSETVKHGETGYLVAERDTDSMAQHLVTLLCDPNLRTAMGAAGRARAVAEFDAQSVTKRMQDVLGRYVKPELVLGLPETDRAHQ